jgi:hypothetical protein
VQQGVRALAQGFGLGRVGRLQDQDGLQDGEDAEGLEERVRGDEQQRRVGEDGGPDDRQEEDGAALGEPAGSWGSVLAAWGLGME